MRELETEIRALRSALDAARGAAAPPHGTALWEPAPVPPDTKKPRGSLEATLASRVFPIVGLFAVLVGVASFLNLAFKMGWIGPAERIGLGLAVGSVLMIVAARRLREEYLLIAEGLIGLGAAIDYLALWASVAIFPALHVPRPAAFAAMVAVTVALGVLAARRRSERLALMGWFGGFVTPVLLAGGPPDRILLGTYLLMLSIALLSLGVRSQFRIVEALTFAAVVCYAPSFVADPSQHWSAAAGTLVATVFFTVFAVAFTLGAVRDGRAAALRLALLLFDTGVYAIVIESAYWYRQQSAGALLFLLAAGLLAASRITVLPGRLRAAYGYLAVGIATLALTALFHRASLFDVLSVEAALLVLIGSRTAERWISLGGAVLFGITGLALLGAAASDPPQHAVVSSLALAFIVFVAALAFALAQVPASAAARPWRAAGTTLLHVVAVAGLSRECVDLLGGPKGLDDPGNPAQLGLSAIWTVYATALFAAGIARRSSLLRWLGLGLFAWTILKVFVVDLSSLEVMYRILSSLGLGIVLVAVSAWYQRAVVRQRPGETDA